MTPASKEKRAIAFSSYNLVKVSCPLTVPFGILEFNFTTLKSRRECSDFVFLNKMFQNKVNCPYLISQVQISVPVKRTRFVSTRRFLAQQDEPKPTFYSESRLLCRGATFMPRVLKNANDCDLYNELVMSKLTDFKALIKHAL